VVELAWPVAAIALIVAIELVHRSHVFRSFRVLSGIGRRSVRTLSMRTRSDYWKERAARKFSFALFCASANVLLGLIVVISPLLLVYFLDRLVSLGVSELVTDLWQRLGLSFIGICYVFCRSQWISLKVERG
jgi:hypothetical protein